MTRLAALIWMIAAPTLMGICVLLVLTVPTLAGHDKGLILPAAVLGALLGVPVSYAVARMIDRLTAKS